MIDEFLYLADLDDVGLGANPSEKSVVFSFPSQTFQNQLVNLGFAAPLHAGIAGTWWDLATEMHTILDDSSAIDVGKDEIPHAKIDFSDFGLKVRVFEVSTCSTKGACEPGYANDVGSSTVLRSGIDPELCFLLTLTYNTQYFDSFLFVVPYDAIAWTETQWNLQGLVRG